MSISLDQLYIIIERQDQRLASLQTEIEKLKNWSDLNDYYLQEMIDSNSSTLDRLLTAIGEMHGTEQLNERLQELEEEDSAPVAQLVKDFIEKNATEEEKRELRRR